MKERAQAILKQYFGYDTFRPGQEEIIGQIFSGRDVMAVMPTGAGKSLCYQVPALALPGITIVISPLISLMKDQVDDLTQSGVPCACLNSSLGETEYREVLRRAYNGEYKLLYVAPERLEVAGFLSLVERLHVSLVAVDEAHCVSQWGHDFRPSYTRIAGLIAQLPVRPVVAAFTATATEQVREDIMRLLTLQAPYTITTGFDRPNLSFAVEHPTKRQEALLSFLKEHSGESGIVYCSTRKTTDAVWKKLQANGFSAEHYHGGMTPEERTQAQEDFVYDRVQIMVATNAFGMGIDKPNIRFVLHYNMPKNMESYYQEAGRAGRDGEPSACMLFFSRQDVLTNQMLIESSTEVPDPSAYDKLARMTDYCHTQRCLRSFILEYFGEPPLTESCHNCSNCNSEGELTDITVETQKILSCVKRMGERFGSSMVVGVLRGADTEMIRKWKFSELSTYGIMKDTSAAVLRDMIAFLVTEGYLKADSGQYPTLSLGAKALPVLRGQENVSIRRKPERVSEKKKEKTAKVSAKASGKEHGTIRNQELFEYLREYRKELALSSHVPPYMVFPDATLRVLAEQCPRTKEKLLEIPGIGEKKLKKYGKRFLEAIQSFVERNDSVKPEPAQPEKPEVIPTEPAPKKRKAPKKPAADKISSKQRLPEDKQTASMPAAPSLIDENGRLAPTVYATYALHQLGKTASAIASMRGMAVSVVEEHLLVCYAQGMKVSHEFASEAVEEQILHTMKTCDGTFDSLRTLLPEIISDNAIRYILIKHTMTPRKEGK